MTGEKKIADAFLTNFLTRSMMSVRLVLVSCSCIPLNSSKEPLSTPGGGLRVMHRKSLTRVRHGVSPGPLKTGSRAVRNAWNTQRTDDSRENRSNLGPSGGDVNDITSSIERPLSYHGEYSSLIIISQIYAI